jgi:hypothetical protein
VHCDDFVHSTQRLASTSQYGVPPPQALSLLAVHSTHEKSDVLHAGVEPLDAQLPSPRHSTQWPAAVSQYGNGAEQSPLELQRRRHWPVTQSSLASHT